MLYNIALLLMVMGFLEATDRTIVETTAGPIRGKLVLDERVNYYSYQSIPYAESPTGDLRFKPPVARKPWTEILNATEEKSVCPQAEGVYKRDRMSEDCLFLNVYVPANATYPLPVMVHTHGGEFKAQSGYSDYQYGPQLLIQHDIILVTMNYRLGALGFLSLDIEGATGNNGIKDVLQSLKWVNENIDRFGGNPEEITLSGNSAGGVLVHALLLSNQSTGLFKRAIMISASILGFRFLAKYPKDNALALAKELGLDTSDTNELLESLKNVNAFDIVAAQESIGDNDTRKGYRPFAPFVPCVEIETSEAIITKNPIDIIKAGIPQNVPILNGFNAQEGIKMLPTIWANSTLQYYLNEDFQRCIPSNIEYPLGSTESIELAESIRQFYFNGSNISNATLTGFVDLVREVQFTVAIDTWIKLYKERSDSNIMYYYDFNFDGELNWAKVQGNIDYPGTAHADELGYLFVTNATKTIIDTVDARTQRTLNIMNTVFSNFVKYGNPTPPGSDIATWPDCGTDRNYMLLNDDPEFQCGPALAHNLQFWDNVYDQYYKYLENGGQLQKKIVP